MSDRDNKGSISMSFDIKADEKAVDFFNRTMKELKDFEKAINERMIQLFDENIGVGGEKADNLQLADMKPKVNYKPGADIDTAIRGAQLSWTTEKETDENTVTDGDNTEPTNPGTGGDIEG